MLSYRHDGEKEFIMMYTFNYNELTEEQIATYEVSEDDTIEISLDECTPEQIDILLEREEVYRCIDCGEIIEDGNQYELHDSDDDLMGYLCDGCRCDYEEDEETGYYYHSDNMVTVNPDTGDEVIVFRGSDTARYAYRCDDCGELFGRHIIYSNNRDVCPNCWDRYDYVECHGCGDYITSEDAYYNEDDGYDYCRSCYEDLNEDIESYHHDNDQSELNFRRCSDEDSSITEYLGVELEVESADGASTCELNERARAIKNVVPWSFMIKHDGSLNDGFEMVSDPCTLKFHLTTFPWEEIASTALDEGMLSDKAENCGLHVHVSRNSLGETESEQDMVIAKLIILFDRFEAEIEKFARRRSTQWAKFYKFKSKKENLEELRKEMNSDLKNKYGSPVGERYHAINLTNRYTIEFRVFKGSLNIETIKASIEFVHEVIEFAKASSLIKIQNCVWTDICHNTEYAELKSYLKRRDLYWHGCENS